MPQESRSELDYEIERVNKARYNQEFSVRALTSAPPTTPTDCGEYFHKLAKTRFDLIRKHGHHRVVLDLCCGVGDYLFKSRDFIESGVGVDFSTKMISVANSKKASMKASQIEFAVCNARQLPYRDKIFDLAYSFSSLYYIPQPQEVVFEAARVLKPDSIAIFEFGNLHSINTIVSKAHSELAIPCHIRVSDMESAIRDAGFEVLECRRFQILPMWGNKPWWLRPLLHPIWKRMLQREINQRMVDELVCNMPIFQRYCFRQLFVCRKRRRQYGCAFIGTTSRRGRVFPCDPENDIPGSSRCLRQGPYWKSVR